MLHEDKTSKPNDDNSSLMSGKPVSGMSAMWILLQLRMTKVVWQLEQLRRKQFASGGQNAGAKRRPKFFWCAPSLFSCAPHMRGTTIVCYRLRDNWSGEVGRGQ